MATMVEASQSVAVKSARFDVDSSCDATFWTEDHTDIDFSDNANVMVIGLDRKFKVRQWNERAQELTGFAQSELVGYSFTYHLLTHPLGNLVEKALNLTWDGENVGCFQIPFFTKSGRKLQLVVNATCSPCGSSDNLLLQAVTTDDVARIRAERDSAVMTVHVDVDGFVKDWDAGAHQISDFARSEMLGRDFVNTFISAQEREPVEDAFMLSLMGKQGDVTPAIPVYSKAGRKKWVSFRSVPQYHIRGEGITGQLAGVVFVGTMTTEPDRTAMPKSDENACFDDHKALSMGMLPTCASLEDLVMIDV